jgi:hypothetical protein
LPVCRPAFIVALPVSSGEAESDSDRGYRRGYHQERGDRGEGRPLQEAEAEEEHARDRMG